MDANNLVSKSNALINASYRLSATEQRIILSVMSQVDPREKITDQDKYALRTSELAELAGIDRRKAWQQLVSSSRSLLSRQISFPLGKKTLTTSIVQSCIYDPEEQQIEVRFAHDILPYISDLRDCFTTYPLSAVGKFTSAYSYRFYELFKQTQNFGKRTIYVNDLREMLKMGDKYKQAKDFRVRVIEPSVADINEHSDIAVRLGNQVKKGRTIVGYEFLIKDKSKSKPKPKKKQPTSEAHAEFEKKQMQLPLEPSPRMAEAEKYLSSIKEVEKETVINAFLEENKQCKKMKRDTNAFKFSLYDYVYKNYISDSK